MKATNFILLLGYVFISFATTQLTATKTYHDIKTELNKYCQQKDFQQLSTNLEWYLANSAFEVKDKLLTWAHKQSLNYPILHHEIAKYYFKKIKKNKQISTDDIKILFNKMIQCLLYAYQGIMFFQKSEVFWGNPAKSNLNSKLISSLNLPNRYNIFSSKFNHWIDRLKKLKIDFCSYKDIIKLLEYSEHNKAPNPGWITTPYFKHYLGWKIGYEKLNPTIKAICQNSLIGYNKEKIIMEIRSYAREFIEYLKTIDTKSNITNEQKWEKLLNPLK